MFVYRLEGPYPPCQKKYSILLKLFHIKNIFICRYEGVCDKDGCDFGSWRLGDHEYYGPGSGFKIDTTKPFTVVTQFMTDDGTENGNLISVGRKYVQNGNVIENSKVFAYYKQ